MDGAHLTPSRFFGLFPFFRLLFHAIFRKLRYFLKKDLIFCRFGFENSANWM